MKGIKLIFSIALALCLSRVAVADEETDAARAATLRSTANTVVSSSSRQQSSGTNSSQQTKVSTSISRTSGATSSVSAQSSTNTAKTNDRNISARTGSVVKDTSGVRSATSDNTSKVISARTATNVLPRATTNQNSVVIESPARSAVRSAATQTRTGTNAQSSSGARSALSISRSAATPSRAASNITSEINSARRNLSSTSASGRLSRAASTGTEVLSANYDNCREVYNSCMDEFCANKDSQLKRCACSSRVNEFDSVKKQLTEAEDKLLDFNQRLLTVNMDKEDAEALYQATEGELAFNQEDTSESKKMLDEIAEKLNTTFADSTLSQNLSPISLTLNVDTAFDSVDSLMGSSTTTKSGTDLYNAALPVCREMALEVCSQAELDIAESAYQMMIEQDCNTVAKAYETQQEQARSKILEGSALLDMSRLNIYQQRNSDDILTCKKKMLDMLTDSSVCGENLGKCLDISGKYIDPSTGEAILTNNLAELGNLIVRPDADHTWMNTSANSTFVTYLNSKKKFLEPAMENCQDIADSVWDAFVEDALAQIKLAQESKLEEVRQGCTTLTTQCLTGAAESIEDFDARALTIFGIQADKTVKAMCAEVQNACTALLETTDGGEDWESGMTEIATDKTYDTILSTCREVGRNCIIQACKSISGNFGLCEDVQNSINRKSIINRTACWDEVVECVAEAGEDAIASIISKLEEEKTIEPEKGYSFYKALYPQGMNNSITIANAGNNTTCVDSTENDAKLKPCVYDICEEECGLNTDNGTYNNETSPECRTCRLAERIWGNCEADPKTDLTETHSHNQIKIPSTGTNDTLLSWFATNTNTEDISDSCRDTTCAAGYKSYYDADTGTTMCVSKQNITDDGAICPIQTYWRVQIKNSFTNCCKYLGDTSKTAASDAFGNCCADIDPNAASNTISGLDWSATEPYFNGSGVPGKPIPEIDTSPTGAVPPNRTLCINTSNARFVASKKVNGVLKYLICIGSGQTPVTYPEEYTNEGNKEIFPSGDTIKCDGYFVEITKQETGNQYDFPTYGDNDKKPLYMFYKDKDGTENTTSTGVIHWQIRQNN